MHPQADLDRLYRKRSEGGRGLISMEDFVEVEFDKSYDQQNNETSATSLQLA